MADLTGQTFGLLTVVARVDGKYYSCICECGQVLKVRSDAIQRNILGCGKCKPRKDLAGLRFGRLFVIGLAIMGARGSIWECQCDCGLLVQKSVSVLLGGVAKSCGCLRRDYTRSRSLTHGQSETKLYSIYLNMKNRCYNQNVPAYKDYGGRGISVCQRWLESFQNFADDVGQPPPGLTLDRYPNNDGNYEPGNVRWATRSQQAFNRRAKRKAA
jgi:hypothetical protein